MKDQGLTGTDVASGLLFAGTSKLVCSTKNLFRRFALLAGVENDCCERGSMSNDGGFLWDFPVRLRTKCQKLRDVDLEGKVELDGGEYLRKRALPFEWTLCIIGSHVFALRSAILIVLSTAVAKDAVSSFQDQSAVSSTLPDRVLFLDG